MSQTRRLRRESARLQAQQRLRRSQAAAHRRSGRRLRHWRDLPGILFQRKALAVIAALALAAIIAVPVFAPGATPVTPTPEVEPTAAATAVAERIPRLYEQPPSTYLKPQSSFSGSIRTQRGNVNVSLNHQEAPDAALNFFFLSREGLYNDGKVLRIEPGKWVELGAVQPDGSTSPGYSMPLPGPATTPRLGSLVAFDRGEGMGSEFAILLTDSPITDAVVHSFGRVTDGLDIVRQLQAGDRLSTIRMSEFEPPEATPTP